MTERPSIHQIKEIIKKKYSDRQFTVGDIYYELFNSFNRSYFGTVRNIIVKLTKEGFLDYYIGIRGIPRMDSEKKNKGAVYKIRK